MVVSNSLSFMLSKIILRTLTIVAVFQFAKMMPTIRVFIAVVMTVSSQMMPPILAGRVRRVMPPMMAGKEMSEPSPGI